MRYLLTIRAPESREALEETVRSFRERVTPRPAEIFVLDDGRRAEALSSSLVAAVDAPRRRIGRCKGSGRCWQAAARSGLPWTLHLDGPVAFVRSVDLTDLAHVLALEPHVASMSLVDEIRPGAGRQMGAGSATAWLMVRDRPHAPAVLLRSRLCRAFPWPSSKDCELDLWRGMEAALPGLGYGVWGNGSPWAAHF